MGFSARLFAKYVMPLGNVYIVEFPTMTLEAILWEKVEETLRRKEQYISILSAKRYGEAWSMCILLLMS